MKKILTAILLLLATNLSAHDTDGFYVIPTGKVVTKEVCNGTPVGNVAFTINTTQSVMRTGNIYSTTTGHLVEITGGVVYGLISGSADFRRAPNTLPSPDSGVKGPYYIINAGYVAFARFL